MRNFLSILLLFTLLISCGDTSIAGGSGTGTGNPAVAVTGMVLSSTGTPIEGAQVQVRNQYAKENPYFPYLGEEFDKDGFVYTDSNGVYFFSLTDTGYYRIEVTYQDQGVSYEFNLDTLGDTRQITDITLAPIDTIHGTITLQGAVVADAQIYIAYSNGSFVRTNTQGVFTLPICKGKFRLYVLSSQITPNGSILTDFFNSPRDITTIELQDYLH